MNASPQPDLITVLHSTVKLPGADPGLLGVTQAGSVDFVRVGETMYSSKRVGIQSRPRY